MATLTDLVEAALLELRAADGDEVLDGLCAAVLARDEERRATVAQLWDRQ